MFLITVTTIYFYFYLFLHFFKNIIFKENDNEKLCGNKFNINHQIIRIYESCTKTREKQLISRTECWKAEFTEDNDWIHENDIINVYQRYEKINQVVNAGRWVSSNYSSKNE